MTELSTASQRQNQASEPMKSTWLSANAGSGKTRVLTDRVARLLLNDVDPQNILCLTYTKAAASEMQNRLFQRLGEWAMLPDTQLREQLKSLGEAKTRDLGHARTLFARAIEAPGGLKIQTIHSFCSSLLRRFPLESGVSPQFVEMDESKQRRLLDDVLNDLAVGPHANVVRDIAKQHGGHEIDRFLLSIVQEQDGFRDDLDRDAVCRIFNLSPNLSLQDIQSELFQGDEAELFAAWLPILKTGSKTEMGAFEKLAGLDLARLSVSDLPVLGEVFLTGETAKAGAYVSKAQNFPTKKTREAHPGLTERLDAFMDRVEDARNAQNRLYSAEKTLCLQRFGNVFLSEYNAQKQSLGLLDFDDLIRKAGDLLSNQSVAAWVLFRLDGGIDHVLIDEAQDTSPAQWKVVECLTQEFGSGHGARDEAKRTLFVVGDKKQSIYSFQGADPDAFDQMNAAFAKRLETTSPLASLSLDFSFRSSPAILNAVDAVFRNRAGEGLGSSSQHVPFKRDLPGRVDLWPLVPPAEKEEETEWYDPVDRQAPNHPTNILAKQLAAEIRRLISDQTVSIVDKTGTRRRVSPGDVLVLVQSRLTLFENIIRACKEAGLPVAGADRLKVAKQIAVKDLVSLLSFLALPENSLSLAEALRSPIFGWSENDLFKLAAPRTEKHLWTALRNRRDEYPETLSILDDLRSSADFLRPFDLLERVLNRHDGRAKLLARLGTEAEDGIDELLNQALRYETAFVPSSTGFLAWLETENTEIKRQMEGAGNSIRVMTVHGAKGLEAPIVILPDSLKEERSRTKSIIAAEDGTALWKPSKAHETPEIRDRKDAEKTAERLENQRLLYVAMTRAENWLIVCGAGKAPDNSKSSSWFGHVEEGLKSDGGAAPFNFPTGQGLRLETGDWTSPAAEQSEDNAVMSVPLPDWVHEPSSARIETQKTLSPSDLGGAKALPGDAGLDEDAALLHGRQIHLLLEHLPVYPKSDWPKMGRALLAFGPDAATEGGADRLVAKVGVILTDPKLSHLFAADALAEVSITADLPELNNQRIHGTIDRLVINETTVLAVDFKSNATVPKRQEDTPSGLLRQMGAYLSALQQIYPDKSVNVAILWTTTGDLMPLSHEIVMSALSSTATS